MVVMVVVVVVVVMVVVVAVAARHLRRDLDLRRAEAEVLADLLHVGVPLQRKGMDRQRIAPRIAPNCARIARELRACSSFS